MDGMTLGIMDITDGTDIMDTMTTAAGMTLGMDILITTTTDGTADGILTGITTTITTDPLSTTGTTGMEAAIRQAQTECSQAGYLHEEAHQSAA